MTRNLKGLRLRKVHIGGDYVVVITGLKITKICWMIIIFTDICFQSILRCLTCQLLLYLVQYLKDKKLVRSTPMFINKNKVNPTLYVNVYVSNLVGMYLDDLQV